MRPRTITRRTITRRTTLSSLGVLVAIGCSSDVDLVDGSGGSGGATTATVGSGVTTVATNSVTTGATTNNSVQSSSSTGGGNVCEQGCAHVATCGFDLCAMAGIDCMNPQFECPMACALDATCQELAGLLNMMPPPELAACLQSCQGGQGGSGQGGGPPDCQGCVFQNDCATPCLTDNECLQGWGQCAQGCTDPVCFDACDAMFPQSAAIYGQVYGCACMACGMECAVPMDPCMAGFGGAGGN